MSEFSIRRPLRIRTPLGFAAVAAVFYLIDGLIVRSSLFAQSPDLLDAVVSFDLTVGLTAAYWLMLVRPKRVAARTALPIFLASVAAATITLPTGHRDLLHDIRYLGIPFELAVVGFIVVGVRRTRRALAASGIELDVPERIRLVLGGSSMQSRVADVIATETSMFYYALASWRRRPFVPANAQPFFYHKKNGYAALLYTLAFVSIVEVAALDFLVRARHHMAANVLLAIGVFTGIWLLGLARAVQQRPILLTPTELQVRNGLQWRLDIPRDAIASIHFGRHNAPPKRTPGYLRTALGQPNAMIELREPLRARGPYGLERMVQRVGLVLDDVRAFEQALSSRGSLSSR